MHVIIALNVQRRIVQLFQQYFFKMMTLSGIQLFTFMVVDNAIFFTFYYGNILTFLNYTGG